MKENHLSRLVSSVLLDVVGQLNTFVPIWYEYDAPNLRWPMEKKMKQRASES